MKRHIRLLYAKRLLFILVFVCTPPEVAVLANEAQDATQSTETRETAKTKTTEMEGMVVKSTKIERNIEHLTDSVSVVTEDRIRLSGFTDTTEILRFTPSVEFKQAGGPGQFNYPKLRGYDDGHFLVLVNGMKINEAYGSGTGNFLGHIDTKLIESVEILRGPQASLYGSDTTAGVMAYTTIGGKPGRHYNVGAEYGSLDWKKGYGALRGGTKTWNYAVGAAYTDSDNVHDEEYYENLSPTVKLGWHPGPVDVELAYLYVESEFQAAELNESSEFLTSRDKHYTFQTPDPNNANEYEHHITTLNVSHRINEAFRQKLVLGWFEKDHYRNDKDDGLLGYETAPFDSFTYNGLTYDKGATVPIYDEGTGEAYGYDHKNLMGDYNLIWDMQIGSTGANTMLYGFEYLYQEGGKWGRYGDVTADTYNYSFYVNDQLMLLNDAMIISAGLRRDEHEVYGSETTGKLGSAYTFLQTGTTLFANYGTSFRAPSFSNLYDPTYGNENIDPETGWTVEGGIRQEFMNGRFDTELTYYYSELDDVIVFDYTIVNPRRDSGYGEYANRDSQEVSGLEFSFNAVLSDHLNLRGNYTYTGSHSEEAGERYRTVQIARNKGNLGLFYKTGKYNFGVSGYYCGPRLRWKGDIEMEEYFRLDVSGRCEIYEGLCLYGRIENLLDEDIEEGLGYEQPGFYGIIGIEYTL
jgi:outer membrane cobalamin receptor